MSHNTPSTARPIRTLSIGGATFDLFMNVSGSSVRAENGNPIIALPLGEKIRVEDIVGVCGGGADNTSVGLSRLGCDAAFCGVLGDDQWGEVIRLNLEKEGVDTRYIAIIEHEHSSFSVILSAPDGERTILTHKSMDRHFHDVTFDREAAREAQAIYLNHIHEKTSVIEDDIVATLAAGGIHLTWNPGGGHIETGLRDKGNRALTAVTDLLLLNKEEALAFTKTDSVADALRALIGAGARIACVTDGPRGAVATDGTSVCTCSALPCTVVDATGAGDAFGTGMTWALLSGKDLPTALKAGTINATHVVGYIGAQAGLLTESQIQTALSETEIHVSSEPF